MESEGRGWRLPGGGRRVEGKGGEGRRGTLVFAKRVPNVSLLGRGKKESLEALEEKEEGSKRRRTK